MNAKTNPELQQLTQTVAELSAALAASERRHAAMARGIRWGTLALVALIVGVAFADSEAIKAHAAQAAGWFGIEDKIATQPPGLDGILESLMATKELQGTLVKIMQSASTIATLETRSYVACNEEREKLPEKEKQAKLCFAKAAVEDLGMFYLKDDDTLPQPPEATDPPEAHMAYGKRMMQGTLMAAGQTIVDSAALIHRLRRDSDLLRDTVNDIGGVHKTLNGIRRELGMMNGMLVSIPAMANEMNAMNRQMSVMSHGVGSTMGRMGNILPW